MTSDFKFNLNSNKLPQLLLKFNNDKKQKV